VDIGDRIRLARQDQGLSQRQLADRAGLSLNGVAIMERGLRVDPHLSTIAAIAIALGMSVAELLEYGGPGTVEEGSDILADFTPELFRQRGVEASDEEVEFARWVVEDCIRLREGGKPKARFVPEGVNADRTMMLIAFYKSQVDTRAFRVDDALQRVRLLVG
jgi:transcriptional regulator with XRE-family HTH domain